MQTLKGKVALVTGASRGVGKGIALGLCAQGATVYVTGRTVGAESESNTLALTSTVQETADEVTALGAGAWPYGATTATTTRPGRWSSGSSRRPGGSTSW